MDIMLSTSAGDLIHKPRESDLWAAYARLYDPARRATDPLDGLTLSDERGNELGVTARGRLRLFYGDRPDHDYSLQLGAAEDFLRLCRLFIAGDFDAVRRLPWERDAGAEPPDAPPLEVVPTPQGMLQAAFPPCPRCQGVLELGALATRSPHGYFVPVQWGRRADARTPDGLGPLRDFAPVHVGRCVNCGHIEMFAR